MTESRLPHQVALLLACLLSGVAHADPIMYTDRLTWQSHSSGLINCEFEGLPNGYYREYEFGLKRPGSRSRRPASSPGAKRRPPESRRPPSVDSMAVRPGS